MQHQRAISKGTCTLMQVSLVCVAQSFPPRGSPRMRFSLNTQTKAQCALCAAHGEDRHLAGIAVVDLLEKPKHCWLIAVGRYRLLLKGLRAGPVDTREALDYASSEEAWPFKASQLESLRKGGPPWSPWCAPGRRRWASCRVRPLRGAQSSPAISGGTSWTQDPRF